MGNKRGLRVFPSHILEKSFNMGRKTSIRKDSWQLLASFVFGGLIIFLIIFSLTAVMWPIRSKSWKYGPLKNDKPDLPGLYHGSADSISSWSISIFNEFSDFNIDFSNMIGITSIVVTFFIAMEVFNTNSLKKAEMAKQEFLSFCKTIKFTDECYSKNRDSFEQEYKKLSARLSFSNVTAGMISLIICLYGVVVSLFILSELADRIRYSKQSLFDSSSGQMASGYEYVYGDGGFIEQMIAFWPALLHPRHFLFVAIFIIIFTYLGLSARFSTFHNSINSGDALDNALRWIVARRILAKWDSVSYPKKKFIHRESG